MISILHNPRCGKSREGLALLEASGKSFELRKYLDNPLSEKEIESLLKKLNLAPIDIIRQKEKVWIENYKVKNLSDKEIIQAMVQFPILIERPIVITDDKAVVGRPPGQINEIL